MQIIKLVTGVTPTCWRVGSIDAIGNTRPSNFALAPVWWRRRPYSCHCSSSGLTKHPLEIRFGRLAVWQQRCYKGTNWCQLREDVERRQEWLVWHGKSRMFFASNTMKQNLNVLWNHRKVQLYCHMNSITSRCKKLSTYIRRSWVCLR